MFDVHKMDKLIVSFKFSQRARKTVFIVVLLWRFAHKLKLVFLEFFGYFITTIRAEREERGDKLKCLKLQIYK